jgi:ADP-heptose:LPS heptosyltransferase
MDLSPRLKDFLATAALVSQLDLIITVDTSVAHLAGALAKPVWTLVQFDPDWRWFLDRPDTPWYPTMRLFRQSQRHQWPPVVALVAEELRRRVAGRS